MFRWTPAASLRAIDLACVDSLTANEVAELVGCSRKAIFNFYRDNRAEIGRARNEITISEATYTKVMDLWDEGYNDDDIGSRVGLSEDAVRRLIFIADFEEGHVEPGADLELMALKMAHPGRLYQDDVRALTEYGSWKRPPTFALAEDTGLRQAA